MNIKKTMRRMRTKGLDRFTQIVELLPEMQEHEKSALRRAYFESDDCRDTRIVFSEYLRLYLNKDNRLSLIPMSEYNNKVLGHSIDYFNKLNKADNDIDRAKLSAELYIGIRGDTDTVNGVLAIFKGMGLEKDILAFMDIDAKIAKSRKENPDMWRNPEYMMHNLCNGVIK